MFKRSILPVAGLLVLFAATARAQDPLPDGPGIYTVVVWVRPHGSSGDAIAASDVSIRVDAAAPIAISGTR